jgi:hypothetical protein
MGDVRKLEAELAHQDFILDSIQRIIDGERVSDFALSYPLIRSAADLRYMAGAFFDLGDDYEEVSKANPATGA